LGIDLALIGIVVGVVAVWMGFDMLYNLLVHARPFPWAGSDDEGEDD
jgi:hypothetical protein